MNYSFSALSLRVRSRLILTNSSNTVTSIPSAVAAWADLLALGLRTSLNHFDQVVLGTPVLAASSSYVSDTNSLRFNFLSNVTGMVGYCWRLWVTISVTRQDTEKPLRVTRASRIAVVGGNHTITDELRQRDTLMSILDLSGDRVKFASVRRCAA